MASVRLVDRVEAVGIDQSTVGLRLGVERDGLLMDGPVGIDQMSTVGLRRCPVRGQTDLHRGGVGIDQMSTVGLRLDASHEGRSTVPHDRVGIDQMSTVGLRRCAGLDDAQESGVDVVGIDQMSTVGLRRERIT